jgi:hypothetical protein
MTNRDDYYRLLYRGLVLIRQACRSGDVERAEAIADALHNLPLELAQPQNLDRYSSLYLTPLIETYPDLAELASYLEAKPSS